MVEQTITMEVRGLSKSFGDRGVLHEIDLDVAEAEGVAVAGANGSGKTTLLRCLAGSLRPDDGEVRWFGRPATSGPQVRRLIGVVAHKSFLYPHLTLRENLVFAARMYDVCEPVDRAEQLLAKAGLSAEGHRLPSQVSCGMRQRLAVVRAVVHDPPILLLDEPAAGLDADGAQWLLDLLLQRRDRGQTVCFSTHDDRFRRRLADRVLQLREGRISQRPAHGSRVA